MGHKYCNLREFSFNLGFPCFISIISFMALMAKDSVHKISWIQENYTEPFLTRRREE